MFKPQEISFENLPVAETILRPLLFQKSEESISWIGKILACFIQSH